MGKPAKWITEQSAAYKRGDIPVKKKCCGKCAFRKNSIERCNSWGWMNLVDGWKAGEVFFCHEGVDGHSQQIAGEPLMVCTGYHATRNTPSYVLSDLAHLDDRLTDSKFYTEAVNKIAS